MRLFSFLFLLIALAFPAYAGPIGNPIVSVQTAAAASSIIIKAAPGVLNGFSATSSSAAGYVLIYDSATVPSNGSVTPKFCYYVASDPGTVAASWLSYPVPFVNGIVIAFSTTGCFSQTLSTTAFISAQYQ